MSSNIDTESPWIHDLGDAARVFDICCDVQRSTTTGVASKARNAAEIAELTTQKKTLELERSLHNKQCETLEYATRTLLEKEDLAKINGLLDRITQRKRVEKKAVLELDLKISKLDEEISLLRKTSKGETGGVVTVTILAERDCEVDFELTYRKW